MTPEKTFVCEKCGHAMAVDIGKEKTHEAPMQKALQRLAGFPLVSLLQTLQELTAVLRDVVRAFGESFPVTQEVLVCGAVTLNISRRHVTIAGGDVQLTPLEFAVMVELVHHCDRVVTPQHLLRQVWGLEYGSEAGYVKGVIRRLRRKIEPDPSRPRYILTELRAGYRLSGMT